jgi:diaminopimelate decarboxylase
VSAELTSTPVFVYDTATAQAALTAIRAALPPGSRVLYAMKANGDARLVRALLAAGDGIDVASGGEWAIARAAVESAGGTKRIGFGGPAKTDAELAAAVAGHAAGRRVTVNVESGWELRRLAALTASLDRPLPVGVRVNRGGVDLDGSHRMTGTPTPFGVDEAALPGVLALARDTPGVDVTGFHLHAVSNNLDATAHAAFIRESVAWSVDTAARHGVDLRECNAGGGFGVDYAGGRRFDLDALRDGLRGAVPDGVTLVVEPGRLAVAAAGWYAAEVVDLKRTHGRWFAVLRGGTHHFRLPAAWGYSHPFEVVPVDAWRYPGPRPEVRDVEVDAVGELCTPRDVLTRDRRVDRLRIGDVLAFGDAGAYGWDISHDRFLKHDPPRIVVV